MEPRCKNPVNLFNFGLSSILVLVQFELLVEFGQQKVGQGSVRIDSVSILFDILGYFFDPFVKERVEFVANVLRYVFAAFCYVEMIAFAFFLEDHQVRSSFDLRFFFI
jgi:hypothetical protein